MDVYSVERRRTDRPPYLVRRLQSVLNASARMIFQLRRSDHITVQYRIMGRLWRRG